MNKSRTVRAVSYTVQQRAVIEEKGKNILVSAAAGSGKTAVLVQRIMRILTEEKVPIDRMLIVTFTNAAAGEMRERISKRLAEKISEKGKDTEFLQGQMGRLSSASISTLHSFCIDILRENFHYLNLSPSFKIATEANAAVLKAKAMEEVLEERYEEGKENFLRMLDAYGGQRTDKKFTELIFRIYHFIQGQPYPLEWLEKRVQDFSVGKEEFLQSPLVIYFTEQLKFQLRNLLISCQEGIRLCKNDFGENLPYLENLYDDEVQIRQLYQTLEEKTFDDFVSALDRISFSRLKAITKKQKEQGLFDEETLEKVKALRTDEIKKKVQEISKMIGKNKMGDYHEQMKILYPYMQELYLFTKAFTQCYEQKKKENELADFSDLEHFALKLLEDNAICQSIREKYEYIFFDEYQDSNLVQETIIEAICREDNLFFVGDIKQSIYGFRLAEPRLFHKRYLNYARSEEKKSVKIDLSKNFRSCREILDFCNDIFRSLMSEQLGEIDYTMEGQALVAGTDFLENEQAVELCIGKKSETDENITHKIIAEKIKSLEGSVWKKKISDKIEEQTLQYRDMVVLMRSPKNSAKQLEEYLKAHGIPCYVDYSSTSFDVIEIRSLLDYLSVIDNERQDEPLLGAMVSYFGDFDEEELTEIRLLCKEGSYYHAVKCYMEKGQDETLRKKIAHFFEKLNEWRTRERLQILSDFLWELVTESGYMNYNALLEKGEERTKNIRGFLQRAEEYETGGAIGGLFSFLCYVERILQEKGDSLEASGIAETENVVRIMSIHKSKGLEFPVVILTELQKQFYLSENTDAVIFHNELGIGPRVVNLEKGIYFDSFAKKVIRSRKKQELLSEEVRILYVALTRAVERLILVGQSTDVETKLQALSKGSLQDKLFNGKSYFDWIVSILIRHQNGGAIRAYANIQTEGEEFLSGDSKFSVHVYEDEDFPNDPFQTNLDVAESEEYKSTNLQLQNLFQERFSYQYPYAEEVQKSYKKGVTRFIREKESAIQVENEQIENDTIEPQEQLSNSFIQQEQESEGNASSVNTFMQEEEFEMPVRHVHMQKERRQEEFPSANHSISETIFASNEELCKLQNMETAEAEHNDMEETNCLSEFRIPKFMQKKIAFSPAKRGTLAHFVLQTLQLKHYTAEEIQMQMEDMVKKELLTEEERKQVEISWIYGFFQSELGKRILNADKVYRERPFMLKKEGYLLEGIIDCYFFEGEKLILVDFKTDKWRNKEKHRRQMELYAQALSENYHCKVSETHIFWLRYGESSLLE